MLIAEACIDTDRPGRYLVQLCKHAAAMGSGRGHRLRMHGDEANAVGDVTVHAEWSDNLGTVTFDPWGQCRLKAEEASLLVQVQAVCVDDLRRIEEIVTNNLVRFSRHQMVIAWRAVDAEVARAHRITAAKQPRVVPRLGRAWWALVAVAAVLGAAHLGAVGYVVTRWGWPLAAVVTILVVSMLAVGGYHMTKIRRARHRSRHCSPE
jgi:hypothetical protein